MKPRTLLILIALASCAGCGHQQPSAHDALMVQSVSQMMLAMRPSREFSSLSARIDKLEQELADLRAQLPAPATSQPATLPADPTTMPTRVPAP